jgi:hypothetical protein
LVQTAAKEIIGAGGHANPQKLPEIVSGKVEN